jgi:putative ABC transport system permease protein
MRWITCVWQWLRSIARRRTLEDGLDEEMRFHLDRHTEKLVRSGISPAEARRQAVLRFGGVDATKENARNEIRPALLDDSVRDLRHGLRVMWRAPGFTIAALLTLAIGIGATSAIFSIVRTVMLQPLPYRDPERLVAVWETNRGGTIRNVIAPANFVEWRERARTLEHFGMVGPATLAIIIDGQPEDISGLAFSSELFHTLGVQPVLGRAYTTEEDLGGKDGVIVLSHEFWQRRLGGRRDVLDMSLTTDGRVRTVVGVMPPGFTVTGQRADFLIPPGQTVEQLRATRGRNNSYAIARLREGASFEHAYGEMRSLYAELEKEVPQRNARRTVMLFRLQDQMVEEVKPAILALIGAVVLVLLVACVNVANLLLARSASREREVGLRTALGAGRPRLVRQMLTESVALAIFGGLAGLIVAALCHRGLLALVGDRIPVPRLEQVTLDLPIVAFTMLVALITGIVFGVVPAVVSTSHTRDALRDGGRHGGGRRLHYVLRALVVSEVALSLVLVTSAGLLMRSFLKLQSVDPGFRADGVLAVGIKLPPTRYDNAKAASVFRESLARIAALPGVQSAAAATCPPLPGQCVGTSFWRVDQAKPADGQLSSGQIRPVTPAFFKTLAIPHLAGRDFSDSDTVDAPPVAIVSEELVRQQFVDGSPIGRRLRINVDHVNGRSDMEWTIVGVVGSIKSSLDGTARQTIFLPTTQRPAGSMQFFVRAQRDPLALASSVAATLRAMEPEAPIEVRTLDEIVSSTIARPRAISVLVGAFAIVALTLAAVGVYGVMAYSVRQRTQEIGVRMALGASATSVFRLVLGQALRLVAIGIGAGLVAAGLLTRLLRQLLYGVEPLDPWTFTVTALVLLAVATIASYVPARRSMRMAPVDALRTN